MRGGMVDIDFIAHISSLSTPPTSLIFSRQHTACARQRARLASCRNRRASPAAGNPTLSYLTQILRLCVSERFQAGNIREDLLRVMARAGDARIFHRCKRG